MTTTTTTTMTSQAENNDNSTPKNGSNGASADAKAKAKATSEAKKEKKKLKEKLRKQTNREKKNNNNNNNNNHVKFDGLITEGVKKGVTISTGTSATMTYDFRRMKKTSAVYTASKGWEHWPDVIGNMESIADTNWKTKCPNKSEYATKRTTKLKNEDGSEIMKEEWIVTDCEKQDELEDNHSNMQRQKTTEHALYRKNGAALYTVLYGQLHPDIITIAKQSTTPDFADVQIDRDVIGLLNILQAICVQNLTGSKVDPYCEHLKIQASTLSYVQKKGESNNEFGDAVMDQVSAAQSQCGVFIFRDHYHIKVLSDNGISDLTGYFILTEEEKKSMMNWRDSSYVRGSSLTTVYQTKHVSFFDNNVLLINRTIPITSLKLLL